MLSKPRIYLEKVESIPHITFVERNSVAFEQLAKLVLKRRFAVMFFLALDVIAHGFELRKTHGKGAVAALPRKIRHRGNFLFNHNDEDRFVSFTKSAAVQVRESAQRRCT